MSGSLRTTAKFRGRCARCRYPINPGDEIGYDSKRRRTVCGRCESESRMERGWKDQRSLLLGMKCE